MTGSAIGSRNLLNNLSSSGYVDAKLAVEQVTEASMNAAHTESAKNGIAC
jgi:hypothetical protein